MKQPEDTTQQSVETLKAQLEQLSADVALLTRTLGAVADEAGAEAVGRATKVADNVRAHSRQAAEAVAAEVEERPLLSLVVALLVGLVLGALFGRQR